MPRCARKASYSNIYHVMIRGINRQAIFEEDEDYRKFLYILRDCVIMADYHIYAYCLMPNHVHLLIDTQGNSLDTIMKSIGIRYVQFYNKKYERTGHLFQDRFKSENVEDERYLLVVLRYILQNPLKAELVNDVGNYRWSSIGAYKTGSDNVTETKYAVEIAGGKDKLLAFIQELNEDDVMDDTSGKRKCITVAKQMMLNVSGCGNLTEFQRLSPEKQNESIRLLHKKGLSMYQIAMLTGKSKTTVHRILNGGTKEPSPRSVLD